MGHTQAAPPFGDSTEQCLVIAQSLREHCLAAGWGQGLQEHPPFLPSHAFTDENGTKLLVLKFPKE